MKIDRWTFVTKIAPIVVFIIGMCGVGLTHYYSIKVFANLTLGLMTLLAYTGFGVLMIIGALQITTWNEK